MRQKTLILPILLASFLVWAGSSGAQQASTPKNNGIGFSSPAAAMSALRSRPGVVFSTYNGWTIAEDTSRQEIWSFAPEQHPAHPTVVRRATVELDGAVMIDMDVLCGGEKTDCDNIVAQFEALNAQVREQIAGNQRREQGSQAAPEMVAAADALLKRFLDAIDTSRIDDAYTMFGRGFKAQVTRKQFADILAQGGSGTTKRQPGRTTWYNNPSNAPEPGTYAVFELPCVLSEERACLDMVVLHAPPSGGFTVMRYERTLIQPNPR